jgi:hypothetical protein
MEDAENSKRLPSIIAEMKNGCFLLQLLTIKFVGIAA